MNVLPCEVENGAAFVAGRRIVTESPAVAPAGVGRLEVGVRPEHVRIAGDGVPAEVVRVADAGRYRVVEARLGDVRINALAGPGEEVPIGGAHLQLAPDKTRLYADGWLVDRAAGS